MTDPAPNASHLKRMHSGASIRADNEVQSSSSPRRTLTDFSRRGSEVQSFNTDRRGTIGKKKHAEEDSQHRHHQKDNLYHLLEELREDGPAGFVSSLSLKLREVEKSLEGCHEQAIGLAKGHADTVRRVLNEAGRLHMENAMLRAQMGHGMVPMVPVLQKQPSMTDAKSSSHSTSGKANTGDSSSHGNVSGKSNIVDPSSQQHVERTPSGNVRATVPSVASPVVLTNDDADRLPGIVSHRSDQAEHGPPSVGENGLRPGLAKEEGTNAARENVRENHTPKRQSPVAVWIDGDTANRPEKPELVAVKADKEVAGDVRNHAGACNGSTSTPTGCDGAPMYTAVLPVEPESPRTPSGVPPKLDQTGLVDMTSDFDSDGEAPADSRMSISMLSEDGTFEYEGGNGGKQVPRTFTLAIPGAKSPDEGDPEEQEDQREVRISGLGPLPFEKQNTGSTISRMNSNGIVFEVLPVWRKTRKSTLHRLFSDRQASGFVSIRQGTSPLLYETNNDEEDASNSEEGEEAEKKKSRWPIPIHPNSSARAFWDLMSLGLVSYDTAAIPMQLFEPPENMFLEFMAWFTRLLWSADMFLSFITGYLKQDGNVEMRLSLIAKKYLMTWFALDLIIVGMDWMEVLLTSVENVAGFARLGKSSRIFRILRLVRLMRLVRMRQVLRILTERLLSELLIILTDILKSMTVIMGLAHLAACIWYGIGISSAESSTWVKAMPRGFTTEQLGFRYAASLHWSLSQFSGGMDEIAPQNPRERIYAILMFLVAFIVAAIFVSSLTSSMTRLIILGNTATQNTFLLRRYLYQNGISNELSLRIQRNAQYTLAERQKYVQEASIELLHLVSEPLRMELHFELYSPMMRYMPFFERYTRECPHVMRKICHRAVTLQHVSSNDVLFTVGEIPASPRVYFVVSGELQYFSISGKATLVSAGQFLAEATMWTQWMHRGVLTAITEARLAMLDSTTFQDIATEFDHPEFSPKLYAAEFVHQLNGCGHDEVSDLPWQDAWEMMRRSSNGDGRDSSCSTGSSTHTGGRSIQLDGVIRGVRSSLGAGIDAVRGSLTGGRNSILGNKSAQSPEAS